MKKLFCLALLGATVLTVSSAQSISIGSYGIERVLTGYTTTVFERICYYDIYKVSSNSREFSHKVVQRISNIRQCPVK